MGADTVFISYSHDSTEHSERVLAFSNKLRELGVDAELDQYHTRPPQGWPQWCEEQLRPGNSKFVLLICTETYRNRVENRVPADEGRGVYWEGGIVYNYIYKAKANERFLPVLFGDESDESIPIPLQGFAKFRIRAFDLSDPKFEALYRELTGQPAIIKPVLGAKVVLGTKTPTPPAIAAPLPEKPALTAFAPPASPPVDIGRIDRYTPAELIGREAETRLIDEAWAKAVAGEAHPRVLTFVALGGEGKTALVAKWAIGQSDKDWPGCEGAFAWSFYTQGTSDQQTASSDLFLAEALTFFGAPAVEGVESAHDKGRRLAKWIGEKRAILILDGLEPLQYAPGPPHDGRLKDEGLRALLKGLAQRNKGLCLVTTRYRIKDLEGYAATAPQLDLAPLSKVAGAELLDRLGVRGTLKERETLTGDVKGHALTLNLIGSYLRDAYGGDIRQRDRIKLAEADAEEQSGHAFRAMDAYVRWFESDGEKGQRALATLRLMGLFDRLADFACLEALWRSPSIEGLTEPLIALNEAQRNIALTRLADAKLVVVNRDAGGALVSLDAHPLLREYFAKQLRASRADAWKAAHRRLFEHLTTTTEDKEAPSLNDLQPLYQAVTHGCLAGMQRQTLETVYRNRILLGTGAFSNSVQWVSSHVTKSGAPFDIYDFAPEATPRSSPFYSVKQLGAYGADLSAVTCFFDLPWQRPTRSVRAEEQAWLLGEAADRLIALGRLDEARKPLEAAVDMHVVHANWADATFGAAFASSYWRAAAAAAAGLNRLELTFGNTRAGIQSAERGIAYAEKSFIENELMFCHAFKADALHQAGDCVEAEAEFSKAQSIQAAADSEHPLLYSQAGFRFCDFLLATAERGAWRRVLVAGTGKSNGECMAPGAPRVAASMRHTLQGNSFGNTKLLLDVCQNVLIHTTQTLTWAAEVGAPHQDFGLGELTLARAGLYRTILEGEHSLEIHMNEGIELHVNEAMHFLRRAAQQDQLPLGLLTRALFCAVTGDFDGAREDLDEAFEIAERGPMRLHLADIHLHRARLFGLIANRPKEYPSEWLSARDDLDAARKLIETCGYGRRREELEDAEAAWERISGTTAPAGSSPA